MPCNCKFESHQIFPARINFAVLLGQESENFKPAPVSWTDDRLIFCLECGAILNRVPEVELRRLRGGGWGRLTLRRAIGTKRQIQGGQIHISGLRVANITRK